MRLHAVPEAARNAGEKRARMHEVPRGSARPMNAGEKRVRLHAVPEAARGPQTRASEGGCPRFSRQRLDARSCGLLVAHERKGSVFFARASPGSPSGFGWAG